MIERPLPAAAAPAVSARWRLLTILTTSYGAGAFGMLGLSPLSPSLVDGFGLTRLQVAFIVPSIYLAGLLFSLPGGRIADRLGVRPALLGGLAVGAIGLFAAALAPSFLAFLFCLFTAGAEGFDSYAAAWAVFAALSGLVALISLLAGPAIDRESHRL